LRKIQQTGPDEVHSGYSRPAYSTVEPSDRKIGSTKVTILTKYGITPPTWAKKANPMPNKLSLIASLIH